MKKYVACIKLVLGFMAMLATVSCAVGTNTPPAIASTPISSFQETGSISNCTITILEAYFWRDWMPFVQHPGTDGGSPLYVRIQFRLDNSSGKAAKLAFSTTIYDQENRTYPIVFQFLPDQYKYVWDGALAAGDNKVVEILTNEGPYLLVGSKISVVVTFTDQDGKTVSVRTPEIEIKQTE